MVVVWIGRWTEPWRISRSLQKDGTLHHWDRSSGATNQDGPIRSQDPHKKTKHCITGTDKVREYSNTQSIGHRNVKKHLGPAGLLSPRRKDSWKTLKHKSVYTQNPYLVHIRHFEHIKGFTRKDVLICTQ